MPQFMSPMAQVAQQRAFAQIANLPPGIRDQLAQAVLQSQKSVQPWHYYSTVRVNLTATGAGPFTYALTSATDYKAFNYAQGQDMSGAGFTSGTLAKAAQTNLLQASQTRDNSDVMIWGLAVEIGETSDPVVAAQVFANSSLNLQLSGTDSYALGRLAFYPGAGGLYGSAASSIVVPDLNSSLAREAGYLSNGNPQSTNFFALPQAFWWNSQGSGKKDSSLVMTMTTQPFTAAAVSDRAAAAAIVAYTHPTSVFCDLTFRLISVSLGERSVNS